MFNLINLSAKNTESLIILAALGLVGFWLWTVHADKGKGETQAVGGAPSLAAEVSAATNIQLLQALANGNNAQAAAQSDLNNHVVTTQAPATGGSAFGQTHAGSV